jgi:hypothetical protein
MKHDEFFKYTFSQTSQAVSFFASVLSPKLVELFDWSSLRLADNESVDTKLGRRQTDLRYVVNAAHTGKPVWVNVILEHQSTPDEHMGWRLLEYQFRLFEQHFAVEPKPKTVPPVLLVVLYHGAERWTQPLRWRDLYQGDQGLHTAIQDNLLDFGYQLVDMCRTPEQDLQQVSPLMQATLGLFRQVFKGGLWEHLASSAQVLRRVYDELGIGPIRAMVEYAGYNEQDPPPPRFMAVIGNVVGPTNAEQLMSWAEKLEKKGEERGIAIGERRGIAIGEERGERRGIAIGEERAEKRILKRVLLKRFGALPPTIDQQLDALSTEQLEAAIEHVFGATSVGSVLDAVRVTKV